MSSPSEEENESGKEYHEVELITLDESSESIQTQDSISNSREKTDENEVEIITCDKTAEDSSIDEVLDCSEAKLYSKSQEEDVNKDHHHEADFIALDDSSENISTEENIDQSEEKTGEISSKTEGRQTNESDNHDVDNCITLDESSDHLEEKAVETPANNHEKDESKSVNPGVDFISLEDSSESIPIEGNMGNSKEKAVETPANNHEKDESNSVNPEVDFISLEDSSESIPIEGNMGNAKEKAVETPANNHEKDENKSVNPEVDFISLEDSSENIPIEGNMGNSKETDSHLKISWELDEEGEEVVEIDEKHVEKKYSEIPFDAPNYNSAFTGYLTEKEFSIETGEHIKNDIVPTKSCFNCLGNHAISECKQRKDFAAIARNKRTILGKKLANLRRYHQDVENKYTCFRPGKISEDLREALGLRSFEAPDYIYRMRLLGYPPGWLKEAEAKRSNLSLFDGMGKALSHPEHEEGETDAPVVKYHPDKLIDYPGFNVPFPNDVEDQHELLNYPTMQTQHSKESFHSFMSMNKASKYKRKKLRDEVPRSTPPVKMAAGDMEVENLEDANAKIEFNPPLPEEPDKPPEPPALPPSPVLEREDGELSEESTDSTKKSSDPPSTPTQEHASSPVTPGSVKRKAPDQETCQGPASTLTKRQHRSSSKGFTLGVIIPESITPHTALPDSEKWGVDASDHILFENLPDALGTWDKLRGVMQSVRTVMMDIHAEDDE